MSKNVLIGTLCCAVVGLGVYAMTRKPNSNNQTVTATSNTGQPAEVKKSVPAKTDQDEKICQFFEKYMLAVRGQQSLKKDAAPLTDNERTSLSEWMTSANLGEMSKTKKADFDECRKSVLVFLKNQPKDTSSKVTALAELTQKMLSVLVDFELTRTKATSCGHTDLAELIDAHFAFAKSLLMARNHVDPKTAAGKPIVKLFGEYFVIYTELFLSLKSKDRPITGQAALLGMQPEELTDQDERKLFTDMHNKLLRISNSITKGDEPERDVLPAIISINTLMLTLKITPEDLEKVTSESYGNFATEMIKLSKK